ncbi:rRNA pseudouridine synthase [Agathobaculum sp. NSJ-28]|uniref:Pseudouridine synthase n=2 Tax=Agathobaculum TaxID=2048137 RepID=A0A923RWA6_9FIRM|nr:MULTISPECIES: pseudouridine synthase [Agathobaculum]MBC5725026.1 rRNA pseudouridine synthase [Agathobaculum faecis]MCU6788472.1 rRNA pseudouridine synthase [Agathobaculum ammoniilyticum]SCI74918.1 Ribosomal small subunit pseudouridine synthase A [uncultured Butyricicoccus sp.]
MAQMRLDKLLTHLNCGSRKEVQALIRAGRVSVEGQVVRDPAAKLDPETAAVSVDGQVQRYRAQRYYMLNKPAGVITASRDTRHPTVLGLFPENERRGLFAVGRLDKDTEGLLIVTDDGALSHALMSPARHVSKVYEAEIEGEMAKDAVQRFAQGMTLKDGTVCRPAKLEHVPAACGQCVRITLQEGKYHQVKRMVAAAGGVVAHLRRVRLGGLSLDPKLAPGEYRLLREEEVVLLRQEPEDEPIG